MDKIVFKISKNVLFVSIYKKDKLYEDLNNTNVIDTKEIVFSTEYIIENLELVSSFLNVIILKQNVKNMVIKDYSIIPLILDVINLIPSITELLIKPDKVISYEIFLKILDNKHLNKLEVYDIPSYLLERLDINKNLDITIRCEILFMSNFMESNKLTTYSDIFYKKHIILNREFDDLDKTDFLAFIKINKYLKVIEFAHFDKELFNLIIRSLFENNFSNIKIIFNEESINLDEVFKEVNIFKKKHEKRLTEDRISFKINYSDTYKKENLFKQINLNFIKITLIAIIFVVALMLGINSFRTFKDNEKYNVIENDLSQILNKVDFNNTTTTTEEVQFIEPSDEDYDVIHSTTTTTIYDVKYEMIFEELLAINDDTIGWLSVNNTNINYPVVVAADNDYYLKRDYYKNKNRHGWVFMDYRNSIDNLSRNTIIYGHNLANQKMFGTLRYALNSYWYTKTSNQIITFNTLNANMKWQIFSIYKVPVTTDYLYTSFASDEKYLEFLNMISGRSIYNFNQTLDATDKILTLSTCSDGNDQRLVVHAKLIKEN